MKLNFSFQLLFLLGVCSSVGYANLLENPENTRFVRSPYLTHKYGRLGKQLEGNFSAGFRRLEQRQQIKAIGFRSAPIELKKSETVGAPAAFGIPLFNHIGLRSAQIGLKSGTVGAPAASLTPGFNLKKEEPVRQTLQVKASQLPVETPIRFRSAQIGLKSGTVGAHLPLWTPVLGHKSANQELAEQRQRTESIKAHAAKVREERAARHAAQVKEEGAARHAAQVKEVKVATPIGLNKSGTVGAPAASLISKVSVPPAFRSCDMRRSGTVVAPAASLMSKLDICANRNSPSKKFPPVSMKSAFRSSDTRRSGTVGAPVSQRSDSGIREIRSLISTTSGTLGAPVLQRSDSGYSSPGSDIAQSYSYSDSLEIIREIRSLISKTTLGAHGLQRSDSGYLSPDSDMEQSGTPGTYSSLGVEIHEIRSLIRGTLS